MYENLTRYGFSEYFQTQYEQEKVSYPDTLPARVISVHRTQYELITNEGVIVGEITGNRLKDKDIYTKPVVGDWVLVRLGRGNDANIIEHIVERHNILKRRRAHSDTDIQIMAANIDIAVLVQSLDQDFSPARIERVLVQLAESNIKPLILFNKSDISYPREQIIDEISRIDSRVPVIFTSVETGEGMADFGNHLISGETIIFIGSSGVGKSSIINTFLDESKQQKTGDISEYSGKGKHTTTARKLFVLDNGVIVIDTPGTREFGLALDDEESIQEAFVHIEALSHNCKFRNCQHKSEPSCAVQEAIQQGELDSETLNNYLKMKEEVRK